MGLDVLGEVVAAHEPLVADGAGEPATPLLLGELHSMWYRHRSLIQQSIQHVQGKVVTVIMREERICLKERIQCLRKKEQQKIAQSVVKILIKYNL